MGSQGSGSKKGESGMGIVSEHLVGLIAKQVEERSLVVW